MSSVSKEQDQYSTLPVTLYTVAQVRELDRIAIEDAHIGSDTLMHRAATFSYEKLKEKWSNATAIIILCGNGNNAGDGYVLASLAKVDGKHVKVFYLCDPATLKGAAALAYEALQEKGIEAKQYTDQDLSDADVIVDALFGTGLDRHIEGNFYRIIERINANNTPVLAIDIPSGLNADNGNVMNIAINAQLTTTFIGLKKGMFTNDGPQYCGEIKFSDLAIPEKVYRNLDCGKRKCQRLRLKQLTKALKPRARNSHKGMFGHVLVIGGDTGYLGAVRMSAEAAARVGAGLVSIATRKNHANLFSMVRPEIMSHSVETVNELIPLIQKANVIAIGPGLGRSEWAKRLLRYVLETALPLIIDADALNLLADGLTIPSQASSSNWVMTPHPGEAAQLLKTDTKAIQSDRFATIDSLHKQYPCPIVLKGSGSLIANTKGDVFVCDLGNPGMSSAGLGDVLTGIIAGLIAQGLEINHATKLGVCIHAKAADLAAQDGERGLMAMDLMPHLRNLVN